MPSRVLWSKTRHQKLRRRPALCPPTSHCRMLRVCVCKGVFVSICVQVYMFVYVHGAGANACSSAWQRMRRIPHRWYCVLCMFITGGLRPEEKTICPTYSQHLSEHGVVVRRKCEDASSSLRRNPFLPPTCNLISSQLNPFTRPHARVNSRPSSTPGSCTRITGIKALVMAGRTSWERRQSSE